MQSGKLSAWKDNTREQSSTYVNHDDDDKHTEETTIDAIAS